MIIDKDMIQNVFNQASEKTVFPYIFWSFIGIGFNICMHNLQWNNVTIKYVITGLVNGGSIVTTYWFLCRYTRPI